MMKVKQEKIKSELKHNDILSSSITKKHKYKNKSIIMSTSYSIVMHPKQLNIPI